MFRMTKTKANMTEERMLNKSMNITRPQGKTVEINSRTYLGLRSHSGDAIFTLGILAVAILDCGTSDQGWMLWDDYRRLPGASTSSLP